LNYRERAKQVAKLYRLSVLDYKRETLDLEDLIYGELLAVAREARKQLRKDIKEKQRLENSID
jgi:hypothetical protein